MTGDKDGPTDGADGTTTAESKRIGRRLAEEGVSVRRSRNRQSTSFFVGGIFFWFGSVCPNSKHRLIPQAKRQRRSSASSESSEKQGASFGRDWPDTPVALLRRVTRLCPFLLMATFSASALMQSSYSCLEAFSALAGLLGHRSGRPCEAIGGCVELGQVQNRCAW